MPPHPLTNFEIQKYYQKELQLNDVYSRNNLTKIKDGAYVLNLDKYEPRGTHWIALYVNGNSIIYFVSFGIYRIQAYNSIMWGYFSIGFIGFTLNIKNLLDYTNLNSPNDYEKNDKIILKYFQ